MAFDDVTPPEELRTDEYVLRPILVADAELDYEAVMESREALRLWEQSTWPEDDFTVDANRKDMEKLERRRAQRESFTYTVMDPTETTCLGCVYVFPTDAPLYTRTTVTALDDDRWSDFDVVTSFWVRTSRLADGLDQRLLDALARWLDDEWPTGPNLFLTSELYEEQVAMFERAGLQRRFRLDDPKHDADDLAFA